MINFRPDLSIQFSALIDGRLTIYGIEATVGPNDTSGRRTATLSHDRATVLVRVSKDGSVHRLIPFANDFATVHIFGAISQEFGVTFDVGHEDLRLFVDGDFHLLDVA